MAWTLRPSRRASASSRTTSAIPVLLMYPTLRKSRLTRFASSAATSAYAPAMVSSARPFRSPVRRTRTSSGTSTTCAANCRSSIGRLLPPHRQRHRLGRRLARDVHRIHHVLDQEQTPAARLLLAGKLLLDVGGFGVGRDRTRQRPVGDAHDDRIGRRLDDDVDRNVALSLAAVLDRVHHTFADSRLEPLEAGRREAEFGDG